MMDPDASAAAVGGLGGGFHNSSDLFAADCSVDRT